MKKIVAIGILASLGVAVLTGLFETSLYSETASNLYGLAGLGFCVFGIWAAILLLKK